MLAAFVHEAYPDSCIDSSLQVDDVCMRMVASSQNHSRIWRHLEIEFVEYSLTFVYLTQLHIKVICDV